MRILTHWWFAAALSLASSLGPAQAQSFPSKPIRLIVPFPPGGVDTTIRLIQNQMGDELGQPVVLENRGGANGFIGLDLVAKSAPDGHTILTSTSRRSRRAA